MTKQADSVIRREQLHHQRQLVRPTFHHQILQNACGEVRLHFNQCVGGGLVVHHSQNTDGIHRIEPLKRVGGVGRGLLLDYPGKNRCIDRMCNQFIDPLFDRTTIPVLWHMSAINMYPKLKAGDAVPPVVLRFKNSTDTPLAALCRAGVPLVLNFGSCT